MKNLIWKRTNRHTKRLDKIKNEFIKAASRSMHVIILNFANLMSKKGLVPKSCCLDLITPIPKEGDKESPENYRGLSIMNTLLKLAHVQIGSKPQSYE